MQPKLSSTAKEIMTVFTMAIAKPVSSPHIPRLLKPIAPKKNAKIANTAETAKIAAFRMPPPKAEFDCRHP